MQLPDLYRHMVRSRLFEVAVADLWNRGLISGEMHLGTGEEAIITGAVTHLRDGDGLSAAHRASAPFLVRGVPPAPMLAEMLGHREGLGHGRGGHMHLHSKQHLAAATGIVGASVPTAAGFALAAQRRESGGIGLGITGTGAMDAGMVLETMNLASAWNLPLVVVCIDNGWAITTPTGDVSGGSLVDRVAAFGWRTDSVDGLDVESVHAVTRRLVEHARAGNGPAFLYSSCPRLDGHFMGDPLARMAGKPLSEGRDVAKRIVGSVFAGPGVKRRDRIAHTRDVLASLQLSRAEPVRGDAADPLTVAASAMDRKGIERALIEQEAEAEVGAAVEEATARMETGDA